MVLRAVLTLVHLGLTVDAIAVLIGVRDRGGTVAVHRAMRVRAH